MMLDRRAAHQITRALLRAKDRNSEITPSEGAIEPHAYARRGSPMNISPAAGIISLPPEGTGEALWNWLTKPPPSSCPADSFPPLFPPLEMRGNIGGSDKRGCDEEWTAARRICKEELLKPVPNRRMTGGYRDIEKCAKGFVSQRCGGNRVK